MPVPLLNFPVSASVDCILSYLQWNFGNDELVPASYRWSDEDRDSKIRISAPFVIDNEKPMSAPFIVVERGTFTFANMTIDNLKSADANTFEGGKHVDWADGVINVICGSGVAGEASSLANYLAIMFQADRSGIIKNSKIFRNLNYMDIGPEIPVVKDSEVRRWEVILRLNTSIQIGWIRTTREPTLWTKAAVYEEGNPSASFSDSGSITLGTDTLTDTSQDFGHLSTNDPQLLQQEFDRGWYYIRFKNNANQQLYTITEIIDNNTLRLQTHDVNNDPVPWSAEETATDVEYDLLWNELHIHMELPTTT